MLESMTHNPLPAKSRSKRYLANAIYDRTSAIMLSGECAMGEYPSRMCKTMDKNSKRLEPTINYWKRFDQNRKY